MAGHRYKSIKEMFEMVDWSPQEEKFMLDMLIDYSLSGKLFGAAQTIALNEIAYALSKTFYKSFSIAKVKKKFDNYKSTYELWNVVSIWPGVIFNTTENKYEASASTWEGILEEHPRAKKYMSGEEKLWCELLFIFADEKHQTISRTSTRSHSKTVEVIEKSDDYDDGENVVADRASLLDKIKNTTAQECGGSIISITYATHRAFMDNFLKDMKMETFEAKNVSTSSYQSSAGSSPSPRH
ncbi:hypothetical protein ACS0TY_017601 [Phlomoides rotata]